MATTNFVSGTTIAADWLNDVDAAVYEKLGNVTTISSFMGSLLDETASSSVRTALGAATAGTLSTSGITDAATSGSNSDITGLSALTSLTSTATEVAGRTALLKGYSGDNNYGGRLDLYSNDGTTARGSIIGTTNGIQMYNDGFTTKDFQLGNGTTLQLRNATASAGTGIAFPATQSASTDANTLDDYRETTFTATATGMTTTPTGTVTAVRCGNLVTMVIPSITGTSNATTFTLTGMPATLRPSGSSRIVLCRVQDNTGAIALGMAVIDSGGTITLYKDVAQTAFTAAGAKSTANTTVSYIL